MNETKIKKIPKSAGGYARNFKHCTTVTMLLSLYKFYFGKLLETEELLNKHAVVEKLANISKLSNLVFIF